MYLLNLFMIFAMLCYSICASANPQADLLLDTIDVFLDAQNMEAVGLNAAYAEQILLDTKQRRYRRIRALSALTLLDPNQARHILPKLMLEDLDREVRCQSVIHLARVFMHSHPQYVETALTKASKAYPQDQGFLSLIHAELKKTR